MADVLVVTSKVKKYIKDKGDCNTSAETVEVLSKAVEGRKAARRKHGDLGFGGGRGHVRLRDRKERLSSRLPEKGIKP